MCGEVVVVVVAILAVRLGGHFALSGCGNVVVLVHLNALIRNGAASAVRRRLASWSHTLRT